MRLGVALLAFVLGVAYISSCAKRNAGAAMPDQTKLLEAFRGEYGRLCTLGAQALNSGRPEADVLEALRGKGTIVTPAYDDIRAQWRRAHAALRACKEADVSATNLRTVALEAKRAVGQEWMVRIPIFTEAA